MLDWLIGDFLQKLYWAGFMDGSMVTGLVLILLYLLSRR